MKKKVKAQKHIHLKQRKIISSGIANNGKLIDMTERLEPDCRCVSKEVRRNRIPINYPDGTFSKCTKLNRWPQFVQNANSDINNCIQVKYKYDAKIAQRKADANLIISRKCIDLNDEEFYILDSIIKNNDKIDRSITTLYRYINCSKM